MPNTHKVNIYRIIQEALQNVNKYSQAQVVYVVIKQDNGMITITVTDDGVGFNTAVAAEGIGLKNLKKRSEALNGKLEIESAVGNGAVVRVQFPV
jgi:signal transduction histidine kinase